MLACMYGGIDPSLHRTHPTQLPLHQHKQPRAKPTFFSFRSFLRCLAAADSSSDSCPPSAPAPAASAASAPSAVLVRSFFCGWGEGVGGMGECVLVDKMDG